MKYDNRCKSPKLLICSFLYSLEGKTSNKWVTLKEADLSCVHQQITSSVVCTYTSSNFLHKQLEPKEYLARFNSLHLDVCKGATKRSAKSDEDDHFCFLDFLGGFLASAWPSSSDEPSMDSSGTSFGALCLVMYSLRIAMVFSLITASCSDRVPDSELTANDSPPRTKVAFALGSRLAATLVWSIFDS